MNELKVFENSEFGKVRITVIDGEPWLVGKDVAAALGYENPTKAIRDHVDEEDRRVGVQNVTPSIIDNLGREQWPTFINESGLYSLVLSSKLPAAKRFKRWVTSEVLPSIRKTGTYSSRPMTDYQRIMVQTREENARIRKAQMYAHLADKYKGASYAQVLDAYATKELSGEFLIPLPELKARTYSAEEVGEIIGCSANMVGRIANSNGLKTPEYGEWFKDKSKYGDKEVSSFRYYDTVLPVMKNLL